jgi:three-Cys-motif partner protein
LKDNQPLEPDGLYLPEIRRHSLIKIRRHNFYAALFSKAMSKKWKHRVYIGLYSGAGRAVLNDTGQIVETSALSVFRQEVPFTKYIFVDADPRCINALKHRIASLEGHFDVELIQKSVNEAVPDIVRSLPSFNPMKKEGMLALCFVDPFRVDLNFDVIRELSRYRMDFLVMLPLGFDLRRNLRRYLEKEDDNRVGQLIDAPNWRTDWRNKRVPDRYFVRFALEKFDQAMERLGFRQRELKDEVPVKISGMGVYLYSLVLYTRHEVGAKFWRTAIADTEEQIDFGM